MLDTPGRPQDLAARTAQQVVCLASYRNRRNGTALWIGSAFAGITCAARKPISFGRVMRLRTSACPAASAPCTWNTCFAMSNPIVVICSMDASFSDGFNVVTLAR